MLGAESGSNTAARSEGWGEVDSEDDTEEFILVEPVMDEYWVILDVFPKYSVSNYGRVINNQTGNEKKISINKYGYCTVDLYRKGIKYKCFVHRLVALGFFLNYKPGVEILHKNMENKTDNSVLNLTMGYTPKED